MNSIPLYKVVIAGDENVGKTSLVRQFCEGRFESSRVSTIGVDFQTKVVKLAGGEVKLTIWDMAGQERFEIVRTGFYRGTRATALVYDLGAIKSMEHLQRWYEETNKNSSCQNFLVVGNKADTVNAPDTQEAEKFAQQIGAEHILTSASTAQGVETLFFKLAELAST